MKGFKIFFAIILIPFLAGCAAALYVSPSATPTPLKAAALTFTSTATPSPTYTPIPTLTPTPRPLTLAFYGDSVLKVGDVSKPGSVGYSMVDALQAKVAPADQIIVSNHGGRNSKWGYENLKINILDIKPDVVTIWWGMNDLGGCPGIFDRDTKKILQYKLAALLNQHLMYLSRQIEALLAADIQVIVITPMPVLGTLPWSHFDANNELVWENDTRCDFNLGLEQEALAQRKLVADFAVQQKPVFLVDAWQIYKDHPNTDNMYMDIVHPGSYGAELIAEGWLKVFQSMKR